MSYKDYNLINWKDIVYYDESSPSFLRWKDDNCWTGKYFRVKKNEIAGVMKKNKYWSIGYNSNKYLAHRIIWILFNENIAHNTVIDHIDRNPYNNNINNLREITVAENLRNTSKYITNTSGYTGVTASRNRKGELIGWTAFWWEDKKNIQKRFLFKNYGEESFILACKCREENIKRLNSIGYNYSETHGS